MEQLIREGIVDHMQRNSYVTPHQHGFVKGKSCTSQLLWVLEKWSELLDNNQSIDNIYFDFQKAFDTVPHNRLIRKLEYYGIKGKMLKWIRDFLANRKQRVTLNGVILDWIDVLSGVPQGSVLGPILFVIYINDLPETVHNILKLFADDTKLFKQIESTEDCQDLQNDIERLEEWSDKWLLRFHPQKCKAMRVGKNHPPFTYHMKDKDGNRVDLTETSVEKDLGVHFDNKINFNDHIQKTVKKSNQTLGLIRRTFQHLNSTILINLFKSRVRPILEYGNVVWSPYLKKDIVAIENVQRRATKLLPGLASLPYDKRLKQLKLPSLMYRRRRGDMIETWKYLNKIYSAESPWFELCDTGNNTRGHSLKLKKKRFRTQRQAHIFSNRVVDDWNSLPTDVVTAPSINSLKNRLDKHWQHLIYITPDTTTGSQTN